MYNMSYASINKSQIYSQPSRKRHVDVAKKSSFNFDDFCASQEEIFEEKCEGKEFKSWIFWHVSGIGCG